MEYNKENQDALYKALWDIKSNLVFIKPFGDDTGQQISANAKFIIEEILDEALAKVENKS